MKSFSLSVILFTIVISPLDIFCQSELVKGFVVTHQRDTIHGFIKFEDWVTSPTEVSMQDSITQLNTTYLASGTFGFKLPSKNEFFKSEHLELDYYYHSIIHETTNPIKRTETVDVFLETLLEGNSMTLLKLIDDDGKPRFFIRNSSALIPLKNIEYTISTNDGTFFHSQPIFRKQIGKLFSDCRGMKTDTLIYSEQALVSLFKSYSACVSQDYKLGGEKKSLWSLGFNTGIGTDEELRSGLYLGVVVEQLLKKKFSNRFIQMRLGGVLVEHDSYNKYGEMKRKKGTLFYAMYGGTYMGLKKIQPFIFTGYSNLCGIVDTGIGFAYEKRFSISAHSGLYELTKGYQSFFVELRFDVTRKR